MHFRYNLVPNIHMHTTKKNLCNLTYVFMNTLYATLLVPNIEITQLIDKR